MKRIIPCAVVALAIASAPSDAQTPFGQGNDGNWLGLALGLAVTALIASEFAQDRDPDPAPQVYRAPVPPVSVAPPPRSYDRFAPDRRRGRALPADCLRRAETSRGMRQVLGRRCLIRNDVRVGRLPDRCLREVSGGGRYRSAYAAPCLRREGYRIGRRDD